MWGLPPGSHVDVDVFLAGVHPEDRPRVEAAIVACTDPLGDGVYHLTYRVIGIADGVERWVSTHGQTIFEDNRPVAFIGAALDISNQKLSEERLRASEERFRQFAEHSSNVLWILDTRTMQLEYLNPIFETVWGQSPERMLGDYARWGESIHPEDRAHVLDTIGRVRQGEGATIEYRIVRPDGSVRWIRDTVFSVRDELGSVLRVGGIAQDITTQNSSIVYVVDADETSRQRLMILLQRAGYDVKAFASGRAFLEVVPALMPGCVVLDIDSPEAGGTTIPGELKARRIALPVIVTGKSGGDVKIAVQAMKAGAVEWLETPYEADELLAAIADAMASTQDTARMDRAAELARARIALMSSREREVLAGVIAGETNKVIGRRLGISPRTVESHRAHVMQQLGARTLPELVLLATAAGIRP